MTISRRKTLALIGGGTLFAVTAPVAGFLMSRTPIKALEPWNLAGHYKDYRMRALSYALLAPNPHNRQPWEIELVGKDGLVIHRDKTRDLPVTDPFSRQLTIGMGCFMELMDLAAAQEGIGVKTILFPDGEDGAVAQCTFTAGAARPNGLFAHAMTRRSHKDAFEEKVLSKSVAAPLQEHADLYLEEKERDTLRRIAHDAWMTEVSMPEAWKESIDLLRIGKSEINANPDGIDVGSPLLDSLALVGLLNRQDALDITNPNARGPIEDTANAILSVPAFAMIRTSENSRVAQISAGRKWLRLNLQATGAGLALRPVSQALQEYSQMRPHYEEIHKRFAHDGETVQMLGLLGYGKRTPRTPRWPLESRMRHV